MTTMTASDFARNISRVLDRMEHGGDEIVVLRNRHPVAKLVPGTTEMRALEAFSDIYGILPEKEGAKWLKDAKSVDKPLSKELKDPWE